MPVYRLDVAYDGSGYRGYAIQVGQRTVQGDLEAALRTYLKMDVKTSVAGRTDAGVHARGQVVSFVLDRELDLPRVRRALNGLLDDAIAVREVSVAEQGFDARFSATWRRYRYSMDTAAVGDPLSRHYVWNVGRTLDLDEMRRTAMVFLGEHDFSSFCRSLEGQSNVRRLTELDLVDDGELVTAWVQANAFCHQMVRSMVGYLYDVGRGFSDGSRAGEVLEARDRGEVATVAPPHGLTLWQVGYDRS